MRSTLICLLAVCGFLCSSAAFGQKIQVSDPTLQLRGNKILITYDILNSGSSDEFTVELVVKDADGKQINAAALTGDIGEMVMGGSGKQITWDLEVDRIEMNADIYVKVYVKAVPPPEPVVVPPVIKEPEEEEGQPEPQKEEIEPQKENPSHTSGGKQFNRTGLILQSVAFPGLGLSRYTGDPHWIRGVLGYGCIAGSVILNRSAVNTYDGIIDLTDYDEKNALYEKSLRQDQFSEALAYTAIAIWVSDLVWTFVGTRDLNNRTSYRERDQDQPFARSCVQCTIAYL